MSTRSFIAHKKGDESGYEGVYCHWDGYLTGNGKLLLEHYSEPNKLASLIELGDMSSLGEEIGTKRSFDSRPENVTTFYGRDRGEKGVEPKLVTKLDDLLKYAENSGCEYFYLWKENKWFYAERAPQYFGCSDGSSFSDLRPLTEEALTEKQDEPT